MSRTLTTRPGTTTARYLAAACLLLLLLFAGLAQNASAAGYRDFSFGTVTAPTAEKAQNKAWVNNGVWWSVMFNTAEARYEIYRLNWATQSWSPTGVAVDSRRTSHADVRWDGQRLYVASAVALTSPDADTAIKVTRYSYDAGTQSYALDVGYPVTVASGRVEEVGIAKDSTGRLWMTYTLGNQVIVSHTTTGDQNWVTPYALPLASASGLSPDDVSAIVAYDGKIGVMWSNQAVPTNHVLGFASHTDGQGDAASSWVYNPVRTGAEVADDHINLKAVSGDSAGRIWAVTKTSLNAPGDPLTKLSVLGRPSTFNRNGRWTEYTVATVADGLTRAIVLVDTEHRELSVVASGPCCSGGTIYVKKTSMDSISFAPGRGTPFINPVTDTTINNPTSTGQNLSSATQLMALAGDDNTKFYVHGTRDLNTDTTPPQTAIDGAPRSSIRNPSATLRFSSNEVDVTFQCSLDGSPFAACVSPRSYSGLADGTHTFAVRALDGGGNPDPTPATTSWTISQDAAYSFAPDADSTVDSFSPDINRGTLAFLSVDGGTHAAREAYMRFTVAGLTTPPVSARLRVYATNGTSGAGLSLFSVGTDWAETDITWNARPPHGAVVATKGAIGDASYVDFNVSAAVNGNGSYGFALATTATDRSDYDSREGVRSPELLLSNGVDVTAPDTVIDSGPSGPTGSTSASFAFTSTEDGSSFQCSRDNVAFASCSSPRLYSGLTEGAHTFAVRAIDLDGNIDATPATRSWTIDTVAPAAPAITSPADGSAFTTHDVTVTGTAVPTSTVRVLDGATPIGSTTADAAGNWSLQASPADGSHTYKADAADAAGNISAPSAPVTIAVTTVPETTIVSGPSGTVVSRSGTFVFSSDETDATFECSLDGAVFAPCTTPKTYTGLAAGAHTFSVRARDAAGSIDATPASQNWTVVSTAFADGFESGSFSAWSLVSTGPGGSAVVQGALVRSGTKAAVLASSSSSSSHAYARKTLDASHPDLTVAADFRMRRAPSLGSSVAFMRLYDGAGVLRASLTREGSLFGSAIRVLHSGNAYSAGSLALNAWARVSLRVVTAGTASRVEVRINGALTYSTSAANLGIAGIRTLQIGDDTKAKTFDTVIDDVTATI